MSETLLLRTPQKRDAILWWVALCWLAFALLPSWSLDYGLFESTREEVIAAYSWSGFNISLLWYILPSLLLVRPLNVQGPENKQRHYFDAGWALLCMIFIVISATLTERGMGYATLVLFIALGMAITLALTRLEWLGGDSFVIGSLVAIVALIGVFIVWPSVAIFYSHVYQRQRRICPAGVYGGTRPGAHCSGHHKLHRPVGCRRDGLHLLRAGAGDLHYPYC